MKLLRVYRLINCHWCRQSRWNEPSAVCRCCLSSPCTPPRVLLATQLYLSSQFRRARVCVARTCASRDTFVRRDVCATRSFRPADRHRSTMFPLMSRSAQLLSNSHFTRSTQDREFILQTAKVLFPREADLTVRYVLFIIVHFYLVDSSPLLNDNYNNK